MQKTNAARLLDKAKVTYELIEYKVDESDLGASHIAAQLGEDIRFVYKTLVLRGDRTGIFVCIIPGDKEVDLKKAAKISGNKSCDLIHLKELQPLTGYIRGGCTIIGMKKPYPGYLHQEAVELPFIYISAGIRGMQIKLSPADFVTFARLTVGDLLPVD